jgi:preprotein translocase subunit SecE
MNMKKEKVKVKAKSQGKAVAVNPGRGQVVRLKSGKSKPLRAKLPPVAKWWETTVNFVAESWQELKKTTWPNRRETIGTTVVVIILVFFISAYLGLVDLGLSALLKKFSRG